MNGANSRRTSYQTTTFSTLELLGELLGDVVVERMHQRLLRLQRVCNPTATRRDRHSPLAAGLRAGSSSAALTAIEVRSRTSSSTARVGAGRGFHLPSLPSTQKTSSRPCAMARLRSVAHLGTTRSGHRCIARCAQSYLPAQRASHVALSSFCQGLCWGTRRQSGAKLGSRHRRGRVPERSHALHLIEEAPAAPQRRLPERRFLYVPWRSDSRPRSASSLRAGAPRGKLGPLYRSVSGRNCRASYGEHRARHYSDPWAPPTCQTIGALRRLLE